MCEGRNGCRLRGLDCLDSPVRRPKKQPWLVRGGSWNNDPNNARTAYRNNNHPDNRNNNAPHHPGSAYRPPGQAFRARPPEFTTIRVVWRRPPGVFWDFKRCTIGTTTHPWRREKFRPTRARRESSETRGQSDRVQG